MLKRLFRLLVLGVVLATVILIAIQGGWLDPVMQRASERVEGSLPNVGPFARTPTPEGVDRTGMVPALWADGVPADALPAAVTRIADGDSIEVRYDDGREEQVRVLLVDAPETAFPVECYSKESSAWLSSVMPVGSRVYLEADTQNRDRYGRELRQVWMAVDGAPYLVNENIVRSGHGVRLIIPPNVKYADPIGSAQAFAKRNGIGLWGPCANWANENAE
jgi:endonuclease YncB( thermonuclease family)